jgi:hypothetical protein
MYHVNVMSRGRCEQRLYCEWFEGMVRKNGEFAGKVIWSDEAQFKMNGTVNRHNRVYWAPVNPQVNLPGVNVWCGLS